MTAVYVFIGMATVIALGASAVCLFAWRRCSRAYSTKRFNSLAAEFTELRASQDELLLAWKRFRSAEGMRELRELRRSGSDRVGGSQRDGDHGRPRQPGDSKRDLRLALGVPDSPVAAALKGTRVAD
jgi:hypothetical protein